MKFSRILGISISIIFVVICILLAESGGAPSSAILNTNMCFQSGCHTSFPLNAMPNLLAVTGFPTTYVPGQRYDMTVTISKNPNASTSAALAGFAAFVNKDGTPNTASVGTLTATDSGTHLAVAGNISYVTHNFPRPDPSTAIFTFRWTAPATGGGNAVLVVGSNSANGDFNNTGDFITKKTFTAQAGATCAYSIAPTSQSFTSNGGAGSVAVTTDAACAWTTTSNSSFITITSGASGSGNGTVNFSVAANTSTASRTGTLTIAGQTFTITQAGVVCTYSMAPTAQTFASSGGTGSVTVSTSDSCAWTATSNSGFITISSGASGSGNGVINFTVAPNTSTTSRTGSLTISGQTFTVTQAAALPENEKQNFAEFADGDLGGGATFSSTLILVNPSATQTAAGTVKLFDSSGNPLTVDINGTVVSGTFPFDIPPQGIRFFSTDGAGTLQVGSVQLSSTVPVAATILFVSPVGTTGVPGVQPLAKFMAPIEYNLPNVKTGVAVSNSTGNPVTVTVNLRDTEGKLVPNGTTTVTLPANGQLARFPDERELFEGRGIDFTRFRGTLEVISPVPVNGMAIRVSPGQFTTEPVAEVK